MSEAEWERHALYSRLENVLGPEHTGTLMTSRNTVGSMVALTAVFSLVVAFLGSTRHG